MSDPITIPTSHQFIHHTMTTIEPGDCIESWCSVHKESTRHLWTGSKLICLDCYPELDPRKQNDD